MFKNTKLLKVQMVVGMMSENELEDISRISRVSKAMTTSPKSSVPNGLGCKKHKLLILKKYIRHNVIIKGFRPKFIISVLYINDMNIIGTPGELENVTYCLKEKFEMKDLDKTKFCLDFQTEHTKNGFYIDNSQQLTNPTVVRHFEAEKVQFRHCKKYEILLVPKYHILVQLIVLAEQDDSGMDTNIFLSTSSILKRLYQIMRQDNCGLTCNWDVSTILYEDIVACITQNQGRFFFAHDLQKECNINIHKIQSCNNLADLFTKALPTSKFENMVRSIGVGHFKEIKTPKEVIKMLHYFCDILSKLEDNPSFSSPMTVSNHIAQKVRQNRYQIQHQVAIPNVDHKIKSHKIKEITNRYSMKGRCNTISKKMSDSFIQTTLNLHHKSFLLFPKFLYSLSLPTPTFISSSMEVLKNSSQSHKLLTYLPHLTSLADVTCFFRQLVLKRSRILIPAPIHTRLRQTRITHNLQHKFLH
ncbi:hypothetical protein LXL04_037628 [Taraxacum kok-saghyz]